MLHIKTTVSPLLSIGTDLKWIDLAVAKPDFDIKVLTWDSKEPDEPPRTDTLIGIEETSKGLTYKWLQHSYPTHWMPLINPPRV